MENNFIGDEITQEMADLIKEYADKDKLHPDWLPMPTYDMVQTGYPTDHGEMVVRPWAGTDEQGRLLPGQGMWCKVEDVRKFIENMSSLFLGDTMKKID
jgi:hypothetical protein